MGVASPCQWGMGECWEASGCSLETTPGPGTVLQASWRPARGQSCGAGGTAHVMRWVRESSGVLRLRPRLARYGPSGWPDRSHRWKSVGFSASSSLTPAGQGGGVRGVMTVSRMAWTKLRLSNCLCPSPSFFNGNGANLAKQRECRSLRVRERQEGAHAKLERYLQRTKLSRHTPPLLLPLSSLFFAEVFLDRPRHSRRQGSSAPTSVRYVSAQFPAQRRAVSQRSPRAGALSLE